jgi:hypothetical protein
MECARVRSPYTRLVAPAAGTIPQMDAALYALPINHRMRPAVNAIVLETLRHYDKLERVCESTGAASFSIASLRSPQRACRGTCRCAPRSAWVLDVEVTETLDPFHKLPHFSSKTLAIVLVR